MDLGSDRPDDTSKVSGYWVGIDFMLKFRRKFSLLIIEKGPTEPKCERASDEANELINSIGSMTTDDRMNGRTDGRTAKFMLSQVHLLLI